MPDSDEQCSDELAYLREEVRRLRAKLDRLTPGLRTILARRGFTVYKKEPSDDLLLPAARHRDRWYELLRRYSFRLFLRDVIKRQDGFTVDQVARYASPEVTGNYVTYLTRMRLARRRGGLLQLSRRPIRSFGTTLEWFIAEALKRELGAEAVWGVKFRRPKVGGDYDVIARFNGELLYGEVKSSPPKQIYDSEIGAFLDRAADLSPGIAVFLMDTELRMKDKIVPMFEKALAGRYRQPPAVERMERELFHVSNRMFIVNAKEDIVQNLRKVLAWHYRSEDARGR